MTLPDCHYTKFIVRHIGDWSPIGIFRYGQAVQSWIISMKGKPQLREPSQR